MCIGFSLLGWHGSGRGLTACQRLALLGVTLAEHTATQTTLAIRAIPRDAAARGGRGGRRWSGRPYRSQTLDFSATTRLYLFLDKIRVRPRYEKRYPSIREEKRRRFKIDKRRRRKRRRREEECTCAPRPGLSGLIRMITYRYPSHLILSDDREQSTHLLATPHPGVAVVRLEQRCEPRLPSLRLALAAAGAGALVTRADRSPRRTPRARDGSEATARGCG